MVLRRRGRYPVIAVDDNGRGMDPDVLRVLTQRKVVEYLRRRRGAALAAGEYEIEVIEGRHGELVPSGGFFGRVLKELADLDNPMRTASGACCC